MLGRFRLPAGCRLRVLGGGTQESLLVVKAGRRVYKYMKRYWTEGDRLPSIVRLRVVISNAVPECFVPQRIVANGVLELEYWGGNERVSEEERIRILIRLKGLGYRYLGDLHKWPNYRVDPYRGARIVDFGIAGFAERDYDLLYPYPNSFWDGVVGVKRIL